METEYRRKEGRGCSYRDSVEFLTGITQLKLILEIISRLFFPDEFSKHWSLGKHMDGKKRGRQIKKKKTATYHVKD
jgi:hypothetical protein